MISVGQYLIAREDVPDMYEPGTEFLKGHKYRIVKILESYVTLENEWLDRSSLSLDPKNTANNYLWTWFREESTVERVLTFLRSTDLSAFGMAIFWLTIAALFTDMLEKQIWMFISLVIIWLYSWLAPVLKKKRKI